MSEILAAGRPDFFGKDSYTPFIGEVEDVNDPLMSGRVKVRCVGWHPKNRKGGKGGDGLPTDDLPWARVGMPVTHAQQGRIGGKHGLVPGCMVMGFFLDGDEAQDPFVMCTFNHTAKTSDKDNRKDEGGKDGKLPESTEGFTKILPASSVTPNISRDTTEEQGSKGFSNPADPAGDTNLSDADSKCGSNLQSVASVRRMKEKFSNEGTNNNAESQNYKVLEADGLCGRVQHAAEDIQRYIQENLPTNQARFVYGDVV